MAGQIEKVKVTGAKWFVGAIEGNNIDSGTVFIEERLNDRRGTAKGYGCTPYKLADAAHAKRLADANEFPLVCDVEFERMTNGKGESESIIVFLAPSKPAQKAA